MPGFTGGKGIGPIGVDLGTHSVRLLQLSGEGEQARVVAAAQHMLPSDKPLTGNAYHQAVGEAIRAMLEHTRFRGRHVVSALPAHVMHFKSIRLPQMPPAELAQAVEWEAADRLQLNGEQVQVQYFNAGEVRQGEELREEIILMAAPIAFTEAHVQTLVSCGLKPVAFDVTPAALCRCFATSTTTTDLNAPGQVIVDVGYSNSKVLIARQGRVLFFKLIDIGGQKMDQMVADQLNLSCAEAAETRQRLAANSDEPGQVQGEVLVGAKSDQEVQRVVYEAVRPAMTELAREVSLCLRYYSVTFRGERPGEVSLVGGEACQPALASLLTEEVGVTVAPMDPLTHVQAERWASLLTSGAGQSAWATAMGMARRRERAATKRRAA